VTAITAVPGREIGRADLDGACHVIAGDEGKPDWLPPPVPPFAHAEICRVHRGCGHPDQHFTCGGLTDGQLHDGEVLRRTELLDRRGAHGRYDHDATNPLRLCR
jgi:hypothetical protein